jgi:hypothetical protein
MSVLPSNYSAGPIASWSKPEPPPSEDYGRPRGRGASDDEDYWRRDRYDDPYSSRHDRDPSRWSTMRAGLGMLVWGMILIGVGGLLALVFGFVAFAAVAGGPGPGGGPDGRELAACFGIGLLVGLGVAALLMFVGTLLCCTIPSASGGRGWAVGLICLIVANVLLIAVQFAVVSGGPGFGRRVGPGGNPAMLMGGFALLELVGFAVSFATSLCFFMVMRAAARYWGDHGLGGSFLTYFVVSFVVPLIVVVINVVVAAGAAGGARPPGRDAGPILVIFNCGLVIFFLVMFIWLITLLSRLRNLIPTVSAYGRHRDDW